MLADDLDRDGNTLLAQTETAGAGHAVGETDQTKDKNLFKLAAKLHGVANQDEDDEDEDDDRRKNMSASEREKDRKN